MTYTFDNLNIPAKNLTKFLKYINTPAIVSARGKYETQFIRDMNIPLSLVRNSESQL